MYICFYVCSTQLFFSFEVNIFYLRLRKSKVWSKKHSCILYPYVRLHRHADVFLFRACSYSKHSACGVGRQAYSFCTTTHQAACPQLLACYLSKNLTTSLGQYSGVERGEWLWTVKKKKKNLYRLHTQWLTTCPQQGWLSFQPVCSQWSESTLKEENLGAVSPEFSESEIKT